MAEDQNKLATSPSSETNRIPVVKSKPMEMYCTKCGKKVVTTVVKQLGAFGYLMAIALFPLGCCCLPCIFTCFKDVVHSCSQCDEILAMKTAPQ